MALTTFDFAEFNSDKDLNLVVKEVQRDTVGELSIQTVKIPGRTGEIYEGTTIGSKNIVVSAIIKADTEAQRIERAKFLAQLVQITADGDLYPLRFSDEPGTTYWSYVSAISNPSRVLERSTDTELDITFNVPEGVGYGEQESSIITEPTLSIVPKGTSKTYPVLTLDVLKPITKAGIATTEEYVYVGSEKEGYENSATSKRILYDRANTMAPWTKITSPTFIIENGIVSADAEMGSNGNSIEIKKKNNRYYYGASKDTKKWQGPLYYRGLPKMLENWTITARFYVNNRYARSRSKIELYLLDDLGTRIGRLMIKDNGIDLQNEILVEVGADNKNKDVFLASRDANKITKKAKTTKKTITIQDKRKETNKKLKYKKGDTYSRKLSISSNSTENVFTDFYGTITLEKKGNQYIATVQRLDSKGVALGKPYSKTYTDTTTTFSDMMKRFSGVALYNSNMPIREDLGTSLATYAQNIVKLTDLRVYDNDLDGTPPGETIDVGDEIIFDLENGMVYKNGEPANFAIGSSFFSIVPGQVNNIGLMPEPSQDFVWTLDYTPRWL